MLDYLGCAAPRRSETMRLISEEPPHDEGNRSAIQTISAHRCVDKDLEKAGSFFSIAFAYSVRPRRPLKSSEATGRRGREGCGLSRPIDLRFAMRPNSTSHAG